MTKAFDGFRALLAGLLKEYAEKTPTSALVGFGNGESWWGEPHAELITFDENGSARLSFRPYIRPLPMGRPDIEVKSPDGSVIYTEMDFERDLSDSQILLRKVDGGIAPQATIMVSYTKEVPVAPSNANALVKPVAYVRPTAIDFILALTPDDVVDPDVRYLQIGDEKWVVSDETRAQALMARGYLQPHEAAGDAIREYGLFLGCETVDGIPPGQRFFTPDEVTKIGIPSSINRILPVVHNGDGGFDATPIVTI